MGVPPKPSVSDIYTIVDGHILLVYVANRKGKTFVHVGPTPTIKVHRYKCQIMWPKILAPIGNLPTGIYMSVGTDANYLVGKFSHQDLYIYFDGITYRENI